MDIVARLVVGMYVYLLALLVALPGNLYLADSLSESTEAWLLSIVLAGYTFVALVVTFLFAYFAAKYLETHQS